MVKFYSAASHFYTPALPNSPPVIICKPIPLPEFDDLANDVSLLCAVGFVCKPSDLSESVTSTTVAEL